ncbi:AAA family ATPase [Edaphobacter sp. 12200R-103]|uniref:phage NrS-1 polymerase family protein n=1 Tax=Edaphobacter sp. 12200R-103 TaxID=2703788 RepID=UPI00138C857E|nr:AAA family ATPase [Edaphobacter sp. 12200R-103]QHS51717.1 AAA family ATPase [Edaphobacter sp. 12200R-103]
MQEIAQNTNEFVKLFAAHRQWVCHSNKVPLNPRTGFNASVTNPDDWSDHAQAVSSAAANDGVGIGFVLTASAGLVCIDLDTHKTTDPNVIALHEEIQRQFSNTYSERSPNGGSHFWMKGSIARSIRSSQDHIEIYNQDRYITFTGNAINNVPVQDCNGTLTALWERLNAGQSKANVPTLFGSQPQTGSDQEICNKAANASNGELFKTLWNGNWQGKYPSQSEADQAFCNIVAFYTDNAEQVVHIFRASALGQRPKAQRNDYVGNMVRKAFDQRLPLPFNPSTLIVPKAQVQNIPLLPIANDIEVVSLSGIVAEAIEWLWDGYLPKGKLTLLAGAGGTGKSTLAFSIAAIVSSGGMWPDGRRCNRPGNVLIWSSEDDPADTIVPRLLAMGADVSKIHLVKTTVGADGQRLPFNPARDIPLLKQKIVANGGIGLFIVDPITSAVAGDMHKANEVRQGLQAVVDLASECNCAVIGITHFAKGTTGRNPAERVIGSVAFGAFARVVLVAAKDEETERRVFVKAKSNISNDTGGFYYAIQARPLNNNITATCIDWGGAIEGSSREILATVEHQDGKDENRSQVDEAKTFLVEELKNGPRYARELIERAHSELGISEKTLQRARRQLTIQTINEGANKGWKWSFVAVGFSNGSIQ